MDRVRSRYEAAGVTVSATTSEASVAKMKDAARGAKKWPCKPDRNNIGVNTSTTTKVA